MAWFKVDDGFGQHPKVLRIPRKQRMAALGLWLSAGTWSAQQETDGFIPDYMLDELGADTSLSDILVTVGLWTKVSQRDKHGLQDDNHEHHADTSGYQFHDWGEYQPLRADLEAKREADRARQAEYRARRKAEQAATSTNTNEDVTPRQQECHSVTNGESAPPDPTRPDPTRPVPSSSVEREDVTALCTYLADWIEANGSKRPTITKRWRNECRLMIDKDGRTPDQIRAAIDWSQQDGFWKANILSMPTLRAKYDQLRLKAQAENQQRRGPVTTDRMLNAIQIGQQLQAEADAQARKELTA